MMEPDARTMLRLEPTPRSNPVFSTTILLASSSRRSGQCNEMRWVVVSGRSRVEISPRPRYALFPKRAPTPDTALTALLKVSSRLLTARSVKRRRRRYPPLF